MAKQLFHPTTSSKPEIIIPAGTQIFESVKCEASDIISQDATIKAMNERGFDYYESIMIYGGTIVMRFKKG